MVREWWVVQGGWPGSCEWFQTAEPNPMGQRRGKEKRTAFILFPCYSAHSQVIIAVPLLEVGLRIPPLSLRMPVSIHELSCELLPQDLVLRFANKCNATSYEGWNFVLVLCSSSVLWRVTWKLSGENLAPQKSMAKLRWTWMGSGFHLCSLLVACT